MHGSGYLAALIAIGIAALVILRRNSRPRALKIERLWIRPLAVTALSLGAILPDPSPWRLQSGALMLVAFILGAGLGWQRGRLMRIEVHAETHEITSIASTAGMVFIFALLGARLLLRGAAAQASTPLGVTPTEIANATMVMVCAMMAAQSAEMWVRARRLLTQARLTSNGRPATMS